MYDATYTVRNVATCMDAIHVAGKEVIVDPQIVVHATDTLHAGLGGGANPVSPGDYPLQCPGFHGWQLGALEHPNRAQDDHAIGWAVPVPQVTSANN